MSSGIWIVKPTQTEAAYARRHKKKDTRCPRWRTCEFTDCPHIRPHWRGTHCSRDRRDDCPTCTAIVDTSIRIIKGKTDEK